MYTFLKAQVSSLTASMVDFLTTMLCVRVLGIWYLTGSITGTIAGGIVNFLMGRKWVFDATSKSVWIQIIKYLLVWLGNLILVTTGIYLLTQFLGFNYMVSKISVSIVVGTTYNYLMQKRFIFTK